MGTATLTSQLTDVSLDPGSPTTIGTGNAQSSETDIQLEGSNCSAVGHSGSVGPASPSSISEFRGAYSTVGGFTRTDMHLHIWVRDLYPIRNANLGGIAVYLYGTSEAIYYATGLDRGYAGGWFHFVINLDAGDRPAASLGTAPSANITRVGMVGNISVTKGEDFLQNAYFDAIRRGTAGQGISFYGGTSGDRLLFTDMTDADTASYGLFRNVGGALFIEGPLTIGVATQTTYLQESLKSLNFANLTVNNGSGGNTIVDAVASDYYRIVLADGTSGVTNVDWADVTLLGVSRSMPFLFTSNLGTGDAFTSLRTTYLFGDVITYNTLCTSDSDKFIECVSIIPGGITLTAPIFSNCDGVTLTAANDLIDGGQTALHNTAVNVAFITTDDPEKITDHSFDNTSGTGHAIEITSTTGTPFTFDGNQFTGYGGTPGSNLVAASGNSSAAIYNNSGGAIEIVVGDGGSNFSVRNGAGATTTVTIGAVTTAVNVKDNEAANLQNARVLLEASDGTGDFPFEESVTITRSGSTASVAHTGHGMFANDVAVIRGAVEPEYNGPHVISNVTANAYDYTVSGTPGTPATGTITSTGAILSGLTDASGDISQSRAFTLATPVIGKIRKSSASPRFKDFPIAGTISITTGLTVNVRMILDE